MAFYRNTFLLWIWTNFVLTHFIISTAHSSYLLNPTICGKAECPVSSQQKFNFEPGLMYKYSYNMTIDTVFDVARNNNSRLNINTVISVEFNTPCEATLKIVKATLVEGTSERSSNNFVDILSENSLRFYFEDGNIQEVCPHKNDTSWVVNFKKGILSSLQNTMKRMDIDNFITEVDVNGKCMTEYKFQEVNRTTLIISKKKDIFSCVNRAQLYSFIPTSSYIFQNRNHKWTPLESSNLCYQYIDHKVITKVFCEERHSFLPLYNQKNGATTDLKFQLELIEEKHLTHAEVEANRNQGDIYKRESLLYDHRRTPKAVSEEQKESKKLITALCKLNSEEFQPDSAEVFNKLIHVTRHLPYLSLSQLFNDSVLLCPSGKKHMIDALPHLRSSAAISVMADVLMQNTLQDSVAKEFLLSIALHSRPDRSTISAVAPLLLKPIKAIELNTMLTVTSLIHSFCQFSLDCEKNEDIINMITHVENMIVDSCYSQDSQKVIFALKAIGNAGVLTPGLISKLQSCIQNPDLLLDIRVAATEAHRRLPCDAGRDFLLNTFTNQTFGTGLRIAAYLQIMKCPSYYVMKGVRQALEKEEINQVGSFVWSHLQNQKKSSMPNRVEIQGMLQDQELNNKFNSDFRKFSGNYEQSFFLNEYGIGGFVVYSVIFSHNSYIPSTVTANITINVFGESVNLAEITLNSQGFEYYIEKLFWRGGVFSKSKVNHLLRFLRTLPLNIKDQVNRIPNIIQNDFKYPKASLSMKLFGNEVKYSVLAGKDDIIDAAESLNPLTIVKHFLSGQELDVEKSLMFIDIRYIAPLSVGMPLILDAVGTATIKLNMAGFFNSTAFTADGLLDIDGKLKPSIALNTVGIMGVDGFFAETSVKLQNKVFTSTAIEGRLKMKGYQLLSLALNLPLKKSEIFSMENQLVVINGKEEIILHGITPGRVEDQICSWPLLDDVFGLQLCTSYLLPNSSTLLESPLLIFTSPVNIRIFLEKSDPSTKKYTFEYKMIKQENKTLLSFEFETPESNIKRSLTAAVFLDATAQNFTLVFQTASNQIKAEGFYLNTPREKSLNFLLDINGKKHVDIQIALYTKEGRHGYTYQPKLLFQINNKLVARLSGSYEWVEKNSVSQCEINLNFRTNRFLTSIKGYVTTNDASVTINMRMDYQFENNTVEFLRFELILGDRSNKQIDKYYCNLLTFSSAYPQINLNTSIQFQRTDSHIDCKTVLKFNPEIMDEKKRLNIELDLNHHKTLLGSKTNLILKIVKPDNLVDMKFALSHQIAQSVSESVAIIRYAIGKEIKINLNVTNPKGNLMFLETKLEVELPLDLKSMILYIFIHEKVVNEFDIDFMGTWFSGHTLSIKGMYHDRSTLDVTIHNIKLVAKSQFFYDVIFNGRLHMSDEEYKVELQVEHNTVKYAIILYHVTTPGVLLHTCGEIQYNHHSYSISNFMDLVNQFIRIELHLDQYRDVHISLRGTHNNTVTTAGFDVSWDVNRDPTQRIVLALESFVKGYLNYEGKFIIEYPGRLITTLVEISHYDTNYNGNAILEWSHTEKINIELFAVYDLMKNGMISFRSQITSPFEKWQLTSLNYGLWLLENSIKSNASITWQQHQSVHLDISCKYIISEELLNLNLKTILNSTIPEISSMHTIFHHVLNDTNFDSGVIIQSAPGHVVSIQSAGYALYDPAIARYSTYIDISIPYNNWTGAYVSCNASLDRHHTFMADLKLIINDRQFTSSIKGTMKTLSESRIIIYFTTPFEKYRNIVGRFMYSSSKKHIVFDVKGSPSIDLGVELKYVYKNMSNFDLFLHAMTGISFVNNMLIVVQKNDKLVDFRTGWNTVMVGITGKSFYESWDNFEYTGVLYTPFEGFKESGIIAKFLNTDSIDFEARAGVAQYKVGLKFQGRDWKKIVGSFVSLENKTDALHLLADINENTSNNLRGLFELDTIIYPTISGNMDIIKQNNVYYVTGNLLLPYLQIDIEDELNYIDIVKLRNHFLMRTNNSLLSELESRLEISGFLTSKVLIKVDAVALSNNKSMDFDMETAYIFQQTGQDSSTESTYKINHKLRTPFEFLDHFYLDFNLQNQNHAYSTNLTLDIKDVRVIVDGSLDMSFDGNYFFTHTEMSVLSPVFMLPVLKLSLTKDFNEVENKLMASVQYIIGSETERSPIKNYIVGGTWHFGGENLFKLSGYILTPHPKLDELRASVHYSHEDQDQLYSLDTFFKYSSDIEMKLRGNVNGNNLVLHVESPYESFRIVEVTGTLRKNEDGTFSIESIMNTNSVIIMKGRMTTSYDIPLYLNLDLYKKDTRQQLVKASMDIRRKLSLGSSKGFDLLLLVHYDKLNINLESDLSISSSENICRVIVMSNHPAYNKVNLTLQLQPARNFISTVRLSGLTNLDFLTTEFSLVCSQWLKGSEGYLKVDLDSTQVKGRSYLAWTLDYLRAIKGFANATYSYHNISRDFSSELFMVSPNASLATLDNIFIGVDFNTFQQNWWFNTNVSLMAPTLSNIAFTSHLRLPHDVHEVHTLVGKLHYTHDMMYLNQLLKYSTASSNMGFKTLAEINRTEDSLDGEILLMAGTNSSVFLHDVINAKNKNPNYELTNVLKSSFINEDLTLKLLYEKPLTNHILTINMFYPKLVTVVGAYVNYNSINNLYATLNCTAPFSNVPSISAQINAVTNYWKYQRHGQMKWHNNTALFNYTHTKTMVSHPEGDNQSNITDGIFIVDFPLATRHVGQVTYTYEDLENWSSGFSKMIYNNEEILQGNFTYRSNTSELLKKDDISVNVNNSYVPLGLKYFSESSNRNALAALPLIVIKRAEVFNLTNSTAFNITGELILGKSVTEERVVLKVLHANTNRSLTVNTMKSKNNTFNTSTVLFLKPNMWFNSALYILSRDNATAYGKKADLSLSYPNRDFFINGEYIWSPDQLFSELLICPNNFYGGNKMVGAVINWRRSEEDLERHYTSLVISHPSFEKNLTLIGEIKFKEWTLLQVNSSLEYVKNKKRKVSLSGWFENKMANIGRKYSMNVFANHPTSRLNLDFASNLTIGRAVFDFNKNIEYQRSYLPLQFWISKLRLDGINQVVQMESRSLRELILVNANYAQEGSLYKLNGSAIKGKENKISGYFYINLDDADSKLIVNLTPDAREQLHMRSRYIDNRHAFLNIWRMYEEVFVSDLTFDTKLNHSRLLFGTLSWRPHIKTEITEKLQSSSKFVWSYIVEAAEFWTEYVKSETIDSLKDIWLDAKPVIQDFMDDIKNVDMLKEDIEYFRQIFNESYNANEFYMQDIYNIYLLLAEEIAFKDKMGSFPKIVNELWNIMGETGETIRQSIIWITETMKQVYVKILDFFSSFLNGETTQQLSQSVSKIIERYDKLIKDLHVHFIHYIESLWNQVADFLTKNWAKCLNAIEPTFIEIVHYIETLFWRGSKQVLEFMYQKQNQFLNSPFFSKESNISQDLDKFYKDLTKKDFFSNLGKYTTMFLGVVKEKYFAVVPFGNEITAVASEIFNEIKVLYKLPAIMFVIDTSHKIYLKVIWVTEYFEIGNKIQKALPVVYHQLSELSHNALANEMKNREPKTKFIFDTESGYIHLEQKLPVPWHSFNETPIFAEIPEYKMLSRFQSWFLPSNASFMNLYYKYYPLLEPSNWLPPFKGQAIIIKDKHFVTFDKKYFSYSGSCSYLLAKDFINNDFALVLKSDFQIPDHHTIAVLIGQYIIEIDLIEDTVKLPNTTMSLPLNLNGNYVFMENSIVTVTSEEKFTLKCNLKYDVCTFDVSGWYFGKTAGLLGTMDNEPSNDILTSRGQLEPDKNKFMESWALETPNCASPASTVHNRQYTDLTGHDRCNSLFASKTSQFSICFHVINPLPFYQLCHMSMNDDDEICTSAVTYVQACLSQDIPLRIPYSCVKCQLENGTQFIEGNFVEVNSGTGPYSADVVFIVDAKECNTRLSLKRHIPTFISLLSKELQEVEVKNNRFSVVTYGGDDVYNKPNNILVNNQVFTSSKTIFEAFKNIQAGNGSADIFGVLKYATKMQFRLGVSKIFILMPCTNCDINNMTLDYSVLNDVLRERGITLHILMNNNFGLGKPRIRRIFYGLDAQTAYTKNDFKAFKGDPDLWRQVKITKSLFGHCTPLALETNGTLFTVKKLGNASVNAAKKFLTVFSKRIAKTAIPPACQMCECSADDNGIDFTECFPCDTPLPSIIDFGNDSTYTLLQSVEESNSEMDIDL